MARWDERGGTGYGADQNRDRWRDDDRERSTWRSQGQGTSERDDERGFFERAGDEIRSWFGDDDERSAGRDYGRGNYGSRSSWDRDDYSRSGNQGGGWTGGSSWDRDRGYGRGGFNAMHEGRSSFGRGQGGQLGRSSRNWDREREHGFGPSRGGASWNPSSDRDRFGSSNRGFGGFREESDFRGQHRSHPQSWGEANRGENELLGYGEFGGTLGGFGNQTFGSSQDDHYRGWRDRQMSQLDNDYADYCREREQQFNQDFDSWRKGRQSQGLGQSSSDELILGGSSTSGVSPGAGTATGTPRERSAVGGGSPTSGSPTQSDTGTETAGTGNGESGRSRNRS
jgi:hypothetical protein